MLHAGCTAVSAKAVQLNQPCCHAMATRTLNALMAACSLRRLWHTVTDGWSWQLQQAPEIWEIPSHLMLHGRAVATASNNRRCRTSCKPLPGLLLATSSTRNAHSSPAPVASADASLLCCLQRRICCLANPPSLPVADASLRLQCSLQRCAHSSPQSAIWHCCAGLSMAPTFWPSTLATTS